MNNDRFIIFHNFSNDISYYTNENHNINFNFISHNLPFSTIHAEIIDRNFHFRPNFWNRATSTQTKIFLTKKEEKNKRERERETEVETRYHALL